MGQFLKDVSWKMDNMYDMSEIYRKYLVSYIWPIFQVDVGQYSIHGALGYVQLPNSIGCSVIGKIIFDPFDLWAPGTVFSSKNNFWLVVYLPL